VNIFISGSYRRLSELSDRRSMLEKLGHHVTSRWLDGKHTVDRLDIASFEDIEDVLHSDCLILQMEEPSVGYLTGGRWVEMGVALASGERIIVVGEGKENVHTHFPGMDVKWGYRLQPVEHYKLWSEVYEAL
jgi:hypothetical protein